MIRMFIVFAFDNNDKAHELAESHGTETWSMYMASCHCSIELVDLPFYLSSS